MSDTYLPNRAGEAPADLTEGERFMWDLYPSYASARGWEPLSDSGAVEAERTAFARAHGRNPAPPVGEFAIEVLRSTLKAMDAERKMLRTAITGALAAMKYPWGTNADCLNAAHAILSRAIAD